MSEGNSSGGEECTTRRISHLAPRTVARVFGERKHTALPHHSRVATSDRREGGERRFIPVGLRVGLSKLNQWIYPIVGACDTESWARPGPVQSMWSFRFTTRKCSVDRLVVHLEGE